MFLKEILVSNCHGHGNRLSPGVLAPEGRPLPGESEIKCVSQYQAIVVIDLNLILIFDFCSF